MNHTRTFHFTLLAATLGLALSACSGGNADGANGTNLGTSGAQDIGQFRGILESGDIPGENTFDANGFFSEHRVQLPEPDCGQTVCLHSMLSVQNDWVFGQYQATLQVAMSSPVDPTTVLRRPHDLVLVIDTSGSMEESGKLSYVKQGLHVFVDHVPAGDRVALIRYDSNVEVVTSLDASMDATALHAYIDTLRPAGATNFHDGLQTGLAMAAEAASPERTSRVLMLSDGMPTVGITDDPSILSMAEGYVRDGIGLTTIGVGSSFNVELMRGLAERGSGNFYFLEDPEAVDEVFTQELQYFLTPLARDLTIEVVSGAGYTLGEVIGTKAWAADGFRGAITIPSVFLTSRTGDATEPEGRRGGGSAIFIEMVPTTGAWQDLADPYRVAQLKLTFTDAASGETQEQTIIVSNPAAPGVSAELPYYSHEAMAKHAAMYNLYLGLRDATRYAVYSHNYSLWILEQLEDSASRWNAEREDADITADLLLVDLFMGNLLERGAQPYDPGDPDACGYYGCPTYEYDDEYSGGWFGCSQAGQGDPSLLVLLIGAVLGLTLRRRRR
jgi:Ca-activated chloride channel family protein